MAGRQIFAGGSLCLAMLLALVCAPGQSQEKSPVWEDVPDDMELTRSDQFDGTSLWGYIDGGADVYLEYGFDRLYALEYKKGNLSIRADLYRMKDVTAAMGIYSISAFRCPDTLDVPGQSCINPYQVQLRKGSYYISLQNDAGSQEALSLMKQLAHSYLEKISDEPDPFPWLECCLGKPGLQIILARGPLGIQNGAPSWASCMEGYRDFELVLIRSMDEPGWVAWARFDGHGSLEKWRKQCPETAGAVFSPASGEDPHEGFLASPDLDPGYLHDLFISFIQTQKP